MEEIARIPVWVRTLATLHTHTLTTNPASILPIGWTNQLLCQQFSLAFDRVRDFSSSALERAVTDLHANTDRPIHTHGVHFMLVSFRVRSFFLKSPRSMWMGMWMGRLCVTPKWMGSTFWSRNSGKRCGTTVHDPPRELPYYLISLSHFSQLKPNATLIQHYEPHS